MNLYLLQADRGDPKVREVVPTYDAAHGFVVRAVDERQARQLAADLCGDEGPNVWWGGTFTSCELLATNVFGEAEVILRDYNAG